jgi:hypothetical protein
MKRHSAPVLAVGLAASAILLAGASALAQAPAAAPARAPQATPTQMVAAQQAAIAKFAAMNGSWRGKGWMLNNGVRTELTVTVRAGPALDGAIEVMEQRSYAPDGKVTFHSFNNFSFDARKNQYLNQARAGGLFSDFPLNATADGYVWQLGFNGSGLRYTGVIKDGVWTESTESFSPDKPTVKSGEFTIRRVATPGWPEAGALTLK